MGVPRRDRTGDEYGAFTVLGPDPDNHRLWHGRWGRWGREGGEMQISFCEFTGDHDHDWDEVGHKKLCEFAGFRRCLLHEQPLTFHQGWKVCCAQCTAPVQTKEVLDSRQTV